MALQFPHIHCVASADPARRALALIQIKKKFNIETDSAADVVILYGDEVSSEILQDNLFQYSFSGKKLIIIKNAHELSEQVGNFFALVLEKIPVCTIIVCEFSEDVLSLKPKKKDSSDFIYRLLAECVLADIAPTVKEPGFEDFISCVKRYDLSKAVCLIEKMLEIKNTSIGPQILGYLISWVSYMNNQKMKTKALKYLWDADRELKERDLPAKLVLEKLLIRLNILK